MKFSFYNSYRFRIILSFLFIISITFLLFVGYNYFNSKSQNLQKITNKVINLESNFSNNIKNFQSFLLYGYKSDSFYNTKREINIDTYKENLLKHKKSLELLLKDIELNNIDLEPILTQGLRTDFSKLDSLTKLLKSKRCELGYRDYGEIGRMRNFAHKLQASNQIAGEDILQLRRSEKDFLLRSDSIYIENFNSLTAKLILKHKNRVEVVKILNEYKKRFNSVTSLYFKIGNNNNNGLYGDIFQINRSINDKINLIETITKNEIANKNKDIAKYVQISFVSIIIFITALIIYLSKILTRDLKRLQVSMHKFINSGFKEYDINNDSEKSKILEVDFLYRAYDLLKENLLENIDGLKLTIEELERTTAYKSSFLANMSHEIRTPLNGIMGVLNLLNQTDLNKKQVKLLEIADYSSGHLLGLINLILDYSKISAGKMELENRVINLNDDLNKLIKIFQFQAKEKGIKLFYDFNKEPNTSKLVLGDTIRINQVIINLLNNAIKFTEKGWVKLDIVQEKLDDEFDTFTFSLEDTGIGIDEEKIKKIFQAFEQVDLSTTRKFGGTGLGLTISNDLAKLMGSELKFKTTENEGACFYFTLNLKCVKEETERVNSNFLIGKLPKLGRTKALIVDDNTMNQKILGLMLEKFNLKIDYANNGLEAVNHVKKHDYDMIFMDIQMPIMDGLEATKIIKKSEKFISKPIPIIAVSASAYSDDRKEATNFGVDDFISKPVELKKLHNLLIKYSLNN